MANINAPTLSYFESFSEELKSKFQRTKILIPNNVATGNYHEEIIRTVLRNFLSTRYSVKTGFIYKSKDEVSKQIDILIIDENIPSVYLFQEGQFAIVMPEAVVCVIEVKSTIDKKGFIQSIENIASAKKLFEFPANIPGIIFNYSGTKPDDLNLDTWFKSPVLTQFDQSPSITPEFILFFNAQTLLTNYPRPYGRGLR